MEYRMARHVDVWTNKKVHKLKIMDKNTSDKVKLNNYKVRPYIQHMFNP